jgi:hypothetical protein
MPDSTLKRAIKEAYASSNVVIYHTLELMHPTFTEPIRVVRDRRLIVARLENSAPYNAGQMVAFQAFAFDFSKPEVTPSGIPQMTITMDNVGRELTANIELSLESGQPIKAIYREYILSDLIGGPQNDPPITLDILNISCTPFTVTATAGFPQMVNKRFPTLAFSAEDYPGLMP